MKGSYSLVIKPPEKAEVGALGMKQFDSSFVVYNGSAFGPGGLKRVFRHFSEDKKIHWHIDYLLDEGSLEMALIYAGEDFECKLSSEMDDPVNGFGSSDCSCNSHLFRYSNVDELFSNISSTASEMKVMDANRYNQYKNAENDESKEDVLRGLPNSKAYQEGRKFRQ